MEPQETQTEQTQETQTQEAQSNEQTQAETQVAQTQEGGTEQTQQSTAEPTQDEQYLVKLKVDGEDKVYDIRDANQRTELQELGQKGFNYTSKMQSFAEAEKARQQQDQMFQALTNNESVWKAAMAQQMGLNPLALSFDPKPPDASWEQINPVAYGRALAEYESQLREKESVTRAVNTYIQSAVQVNNQALFQRGKIVHNLNDQEASQVTQFMQSEMRTNATGLYSDQQYERAVNALFGKERTSQARLQTANNIQTKIKNAISPPRTPTRAVQATTPQENSATAFKEFVKDWSGKK